MTCIHFKVLTRPWFENSEVWIRTRDLWIPRSPRVGDRRSTHLVTTTGFLWIWYLPPFWNESAGIDAMENVDTFLFNSSRPSHKQLFYTCLRHVVFSYNKEPFQAFQMPYSHEELVIMQFGLSGSTHCGVLPPGGSNRH